MLGVSQPALTVQIQQLESALGVVLLDRKTRSVTLTRAGEELLGPLERILVDFEAIVGTGRDLATLARGTVTVAAVPTLAASLLPRALARFCQAHPGMSVRLRDVGQGLIALVKSGEVDLGVGGDTKRHPEVAVEDLYSEPICLFAPETHELANRQTVALAELVQYRVILPQYHGSLRTILQRALDRQRIHFHHFHETSHISTTIGMVSAGLGLGILPLRALECCGGAGIRCIPISEPALERRVVIATRAGRSVSPPLQKLIEILHDVSRQFPPRFPPAVFRTATTGTTPRRRQVRPPKRSA